ncbi:hypothetical protein AB1L30_10935 [Bremerella sp. JC817]|uniref:hypothetical protein n=1 Tax=Bremerella sp. JC817 TaxID=3231756 RepID=UPI0034586FBF
MEIQVSQFFRQGCKCPHGRVTPERDEEQQTSLDICNGFECWFSDKLDLVDWQTRVFPQEFLAV